MESYSFFFFFKQKTAYEIKECYWSSDVCSSDLTISFLPFGGFRGRGQELQQRENIVLGRILGSFDRRAVGFDRHDAFAHLLRLTEEIDGVAVDRKSVV